MNHSKVITDNEVKEMFDICAEELGLRGMTVHVYNIETHNGHWGGSSVGKNRVTATTGEQSNKRTYPYFLERPKKILIDSKDRWMLVTETDTHTYWSKKPDYVDKYREGPHLSMLLLNIQEWVLHLLAHELRHQWQRKRRPMHQFTYTVRHKHKNYFRGERDADCFAIKMVRIWRKIHNVDIYPEQPDQTIIAEQEKVIFF